MDLCNVHVTTNRIQNTQINYQVRFSKAWHTTPNPITPCLGHIIHTLALKYNPQQCIYTDISFMPLDENEVGNTIGSWIYSPTHNLRITDRIPNLQNILRVELYAILIALNATHSHPQGVYILTYSLNSVYIWPIPHHIGYMALQLDRLMEPSVTYIPYINNKH